MRNACDPVKDGGMRSATAYRPVIGLLAHSLTPFSFMLLSVGIGLLMLWCLAGLSSVASFAISSAQPSQDANYTIVYTDGSMRGRERERES